MSTKPRILIVEDDTTLREGLQVALSGQDLHVETAADGHLAQRLLGGLHFDLVLLDLMLPGPGGLEVLRSLRSRDRVTPVIVLTARGDESDKVVALELGADDYVTKPFGLRELIARVRAQLRRSGRLDGEPAHCAEPFTLGAVRVDLAAFRVVGPRGESALSPREAGILSLLYAEAGRAVHRNTILDVVWGRDAYVTHRTIDTHVLNLRQKIEADPKVPRHLLAVHGIGYRLDLEPTES